MSDWESRKAEQRRANDAVVAKYGEGIGWPKPMPPRIPEDAGIDCGAHNCACAYYPQHINEMQDEIENLYRIIVEMRDAVANADLMSPRIVIANLPIRVSPTLEAMKNDQ